MWFIQPLMVFIGCIVAATAVPVFWLSLHVDTGPYERPKALWLRQLSKCATNTWLALLSIEIMMVVASVMSIAYWC